MPATTPDALQKKKLTRQARQQKAAKEKAETSKPKPKNETNHTAPEPESKTTLAIDIDKQLQLKTLEKEVLELKQDRAQRKQATKGTKEAPKGSDESNNWDHWGSSAKKKTKAGNTWGDDKGYKNHQWDKGSWAGASWDEPTGVAG